MLRTGFITAAFILIVATGCRENNGSTETIANEIVQEKSGEIHLNLKDAYLLHDEKNPSDTTDEWHFHLLTKGRYEVWLSSLTCDTMNLTYEEPVIIHIGDKRLQGQPVGNEIVLNDKSVEEPYFRADSRLGSILIENEGHYNLQVVSEKVLPSPKKEGPNQARTILNQVILKPQAQ